MVIGITHRQKQSPRGALQKGALGNFTRATGKHPCQSLSFNKTAGRRPATLLEKRRQHRRPLVNSVKSPRTPSFTEHLLWSVVAASIQKQKVP